MSNTLMKIGGVGCVLWLVAALLIAIAAFLTLGGGLSMFNVIVILAIVGLVLFIPGGIIFGFGCIGMWKNYQHPLPLIGSIFAFIFGIMPMITLIGSFMSLAGTATWTARIGYFTGGIAMLLIGISIILLRAKTGLGTLAIGTAVMFVIAGCVYISTIGVFNPLLNTIWQTIAVVAMLLGTVFFFKAQ